MDESQRLKAGVIGCGLVAREFHVPSLAEIAQVDLRALCDAREDVASELAKKYRVPSVYKTAEEMLERESLDFVHVLTPPESHIDVALLVMDKGCHAMIEKPFTYKVEEVDRLIEKSKETGKRFSVIQNNLFHPAVAEFKKLVLSGKIGELCSVHFMSSRRDQTFVPSNWYFDTYGGRMGETLPHAIYPLVEFAEDFEVTFAKASKLGHCIVPDRFKGDYRVDQLQVELESKEKNIVGNISYGFNSGMSPATIAGGTKGSLMLLNYRTIVPLSGKEQPKPGKVINEWFSGHVKKIKKKLGKGKKPSIRDKSHFVQIRRFVDSLQTGHEFDVTPSKARSVVRLWENITASYENQS